MPHKTAAEREEAVRLAYNAVISEGLKPHQAAIRYGAPRTTVYDRVHGKLPRHKAQACRQLLSPAQVRGHFYFHFHVMIDVT